MTKEPRTIPFSEPFTGNDQQMAVGRTLDPTDHFLGNYGNKIAVVQQI